MIALGSRASLLLGLLYGGARTAAELVDLIGDTLADPDLLAGLPDTWGSPRISLRSLYDAGACEVERILARLEDVGFATSVTLNGDTLWTARLPTR